MLLLPTWVISHRLLASRGPALQGVLLRTSGVVPAGVLDVISTLQTITLAAALFALGTGVHLGKLLHSGGRPLALGMVSTLVVATVSLVGVLAIA